MLELYIVLPIFYLYLWNGFDVFLAINLGHFNGIDELDKYELCIHVGSQCKAEI